MTHHFQSLNSLAFWALNNLSPNHFCQFLRKFVGRIEFYLHSPNYTHLSPTILGKFAFMFSTFGSAAFFAWNVLLSFSPFTEIQLNNEAQIK